MCQLRRRRHRSDARAPAQPPAASTRTVPRAAHHFVEEVRVHAQEEAAEVVGEGATSWIRVASPGPPPPMRLPAHEVVEGTGSVVVAIEKWGHNCGKGNSGHDENPRCHRWKPRQRQVSSEPRAAHGVAVAARRTALHFSRVIRTRAPAVEARGVHVAHGASALARGNKATCLRPAKADAAHGRIGVGIRVRARFGSSGRALVEVRTPILSPFPRLSSPAQAAFGHVRQCCTGGGACAACGLLLSGQLLLQPTYTFTNGDQERRTCHVRLR